MSPVSIIRVLSVTLLLCAVAACGQKGPLFLPPPDVTAPAAAEPGPSTGPERDTAPAAELPAGDAAETAPATN